jgi:hypothetical protein
MRRERESRIGEGSVRGGRGKGGEKMTGKGG